jgi:ABC-type uncharacterized transport system fused permease/ATPase subunit
MRKEIIERLASLSVAAFGLVAALAWNSFILKLFENVFGVSEGLTAMFLYAVIVTIIAVVVTIQIGKINSKK